MMEKLISIITPCYNGEKYIDRYAEALLKQTYSNCQLIFMDDGSTDSSKEKIFEYKERFEKKGIILEYHYHDNIGLGGTIAEGIQYVRGEYFIWPDIDDVLPPTSIEVKVNFLEKYSQYGVVRTNFILAQDEPQNIIDENATLKYVNRTKEDLFEDYLVSRNMWLQPGCYMIRTSTYDIANPGRYIFPTRTGQDWQILLPILFHSKCGYLDDRLYIYILRSDSMSKMVRTTFEKEKQQLENYNELISMTIKHMNLSDEEKYLKMVRTYYDQQQISLGYRRGNKAWAVENWKKLSPEDRNLKLWVKKTFAQNKIVKKILEKVV